MSPRRRWRPEVNTPEYRQAQTRAISAVGIAKLRGYLPYLRDGKTACADCGKVATVYDHRDYTKPLEVTPVCQKCNLKRGRAHWFNDQFLGEGI